MHLWAMIYYISIPQHNLKRLMYLNYVIIPNDDDDHDDFKGKKMFNRQNKIIKMKISNLF